MGPLMIDVQGTSLTAEDIELLQHPLVGGLILFTRNYQSPRQLSQLTSAIKKNASNNIIIAVDHEGGRVQRFREGFSQIPPMGQIWNVANEHLPTAITYAKAAGILMATEVQAVGIDISFAPVLDINGVSDVIGDRAFHQDPALITLLAKAFIEGMKSVGMLATAKHFPGHGSVKEDSHIALPVDQRSAQEVFSVDMIPFKKLITHVAAVMPAHVIFPAVDQHAVGFSRKWLQDILRNELGFDGVIFSDDLSMQGASVVGGFIERAEAAQQAGCDMLLACNNRSAVIDILDNANIKCVAESEHRLKNMLYKGDLSPHVMMNAWEKRKEQPIWQYASDIVANIVAKII